MEIRPFEALGTLSFGDSRSTVREKLGKEYSSFSKKTGDVPTDAYDSLGLHLYYDQDERLEFVEAFEPAVITMNGITFLGRQVADVVHELGVKGFESVNADVGFDVPAAGIAITSLSGIIEGVAVHRKGYFDD
jgi:hypothetical protein